VTTSSVECAELGEYGGDLSEESGKEHPEHQRKESPGEGKGKIENEIEKEDHDLESLRLRGTGNMAAAEMPPEQLVGLFGTHSGEQENRTVWTLYD
jgi:hypothetical protein